MTVTYPEVHGILFLRRTLSLSLHLFFAFPSTVFFQPFWFSSAVMTPAKPSFPFPFSSALLVFLPVSICGTFCFYGHWELSVSAFGEGRETVL